MKSKIAFIFIALILIISLSACEVSEEYIPDDGLSTDTSHEHSFGSWKTKTPATCTAAEIQVRTCQCGAEETRNGDPATPHTYTVQSTDSKYLASAECGSYTNYYYSCQCGEKGKRIFPYGEILSHNYNKSVVTPTCASEGYTRYTCSRCNDSYKDTIVAAIGHTPGEAATCKTAQTCTVCKAEIVAAKGHNYVEEVIAPTCIEEGYTKHKCSVCNYTYKDNKVDTVGHTYTPKVVEPTCTERGYTQYNCTVCKNSSYKKDYTDAIGHNYIYEATTKPTTSEAGVLSKACSNCSDATTTVTLPKISEADYTKTVIKTATCTENGKNEWKWNDTTYGTFTFTVYIMAKGHKYDSVVTKPTCTTAGYTTHSCSRCDDSYTDTPVAAKGHTAGAAATCTAAQTCTVCSKELVAAKGHSYVKEVIAPTCTTEGYTKHKCSVCNYTYKDNKVDALKHNYSYEVTTKPTSSETGVLTKICSNCSDSTTTVTLPAVTEADYTKAVVKAATCTESGKNEWTWNDTTYGTFTFTFYVMAKGHKFNSYTSDATNHWQACQRDGCTEIQNKAAHSGGTATLTSKAKCSTCDKAYGTTNQPVVLGDTYISSYSKDTSYSSSTTINANKGSYRPIIKFNLSKVLKSADFKENGAKISFTFAVDSESLTNLNDASQQFNAYAFSAGSGVSDANLSTLTWNNCATGSALHRGAANFLIQDQTLADCSSNVSIKTTNGVTYVTFTFDYSAIKAYVSTANATYGYLVMGFDFSKTVKLYSADSSNPPVVTITNGK